MSPWLLLKAIKARLAPRLETLPLPVRGRDAAGRPVPPRSEPGQPDTPLPACRPAVLHLGSMPPTAQGALESAPFVVAQAMGGFERAGLHHVRVALRCCIVGDDLEAAEEDMQNLLSLQRLALLEAPLLERRFQLVPDLQEQIAPWERPDEQMFPFLQAHIITTWNLQGVAHVAV